MPSPGRAPGSGATARLFGERGASVGLIARGQAGLDGAVRDVEEAGGKALAVSADVADYGQVTAAAEQIEEFFGPIDVWINVAFTSVFAPFAEITAEEFRRVTEVSYLGFVHGTMAALALMRPRGRGTIVQVGSALGERSIPLQSAYCGAKHAINGFTSSLRCELLHENSGVHVTAVQMPAVNTPQFSWVRSRLPKHPQPVPPIYQPEVAARGVVFAADHPRRRQYWVGDHDGRHRRQPAGPGPAGQVPRPYRLPRPADRAARRARPSGQPAPAGGRDQRARPGLTRRLRRQVPRPQPAAVDLTARPHVLRAPCGGGGHRGVPGGVARAPPVTAPAATERALQLARAGYGAALVLAPGPAILLATGRLPGRRACRVARLLGARHLRGPHFAGPPPGHDRRGDWRAVARSAAG